MTPTHQPTTLNPRRPKPMPASLAGTRLQDRALALSASCPGGPA